MTFLLPGQEKWPVPDVGQDCLQIRPTAGSVVGPNEGGDVRLFVSWSGGKDSALAAYRAWREGHQLTYLLNCTAEDGIRTRSHGLPVEVIDLQARAMGMPLLRVQTSWNEYEAKFKEAVRTLRDEGVEGGVFGDMAIEDHREWVERVCAEVGVQALLPLWGDDPWALLVEFWNAGFQAVVVATRLEPGFVGRPLDSVLVAEMVSRGAHPCGEGGEYHTLVTDGPLFRFPLHIEFPESQSISYERDGVWFLNVAGILGAPGASRV